MTDLRNIASGYAVSRGWAVFPTHGITADGICTCGNAACKSPGKHPAPTAPQGVKNATKDPRALALMFRDGFNIGVATGEPSGFWVLDIDGQAGEQSLATLEAEHGALPATLVHFTGNGRHLLFKWPGFQIKNSVKRLGDGLDIRGDGGYIVAAPSRHASGAQYRFADSVAPIADAPKWLLSLIQQEAPSHIDASVSYPEPDRQLSADEVRAMLGYISPDTDYQTWLEIGMGLHAGGYPVQIWDEWSRGGAKYQNGDCYKRWKGFKPGAVTFGTVWHHAAVHGWSPSELEPVKLDGPHPAAGFLAKVRARPKKKDEPRPEGFPFDPLQLTGTIGDTVRWICSSAIKPQPELALLNTLAALGAVFGRRYATAWDTRTNVYIVGLAGTGSGKEHSRKQIKKLMVAAGLHDFLAGDSVVGGPGMLRGVAAHPAQILHLDEFGMLLKAITDERGASHMRIVAKNLTELFTASSSVFHGGSYSSAEVKPIIIDHPNLCIYGSSTIEKYVEALSRSAISSGELNRFIVIEGREDVRRSRDVQDHEPSARLVGEWTTFAKQIAEGQGNLQAVGGPNVAAPKPIVLRWDDVIERLHDMGDFEDAQMHQYRGEGKAGVWSRYREQVIKLAMICAIARNPVVPGMEPGDIDFAEAIVRHSCDLVMRIARDSIADNKQEGDVNKILRLIRDAGEGGISKTALHQQARGIAPRARGDIIADLIASDEIMAVAGEAARGRKPINYIYIND